MRLRVHYEAGDTIVEVLVAIVIVATILGGAYVTASHSLLNVRESQERGEALNLAEGQVEALRWLAMSVNTATSGNTVFNDPNLFCIITDVKAGTAITDAIQDTSTKNDLAVGTMPTLSQESALPPSLTYNIATNPNNCQFHTQSNGFVYDIAIDRCASSLSGTDLGTGSCVAYTSEPTNSALFIVHVRWDSINSTTRDDVTVQYRLYEAQG
jgi:Tfp pilus assembly protein PilV